MLSQISSHQTVQVKRCAFTLRDAVGAVRIRHYREVFICGDKGVDQKLRSLVMDVVITGTVNDQEVALQVLCEGERRRILVVIRVVLWQSKITLSVDGV